MKRKPCRPAPHDDVTPLDDLMAVADATREVHLEEADLEQAFLERIVAAAGISGEQAEAVNGGLAAKLFRVA